MDIRRATCNQCGERADCALAKRKVGGSYRRAGGYRSCRICRRCAEELWADAKASPGSMSTQRWGNYGLFSVVKTWKELDR